MLGKDNFSSTNIYKKITFLYPKSNLLIPIEWFCAQSYVFGTRPRPNNMINDPVTHLRRLGIGNERDQRWLMGTWLFVEKDATIKYYLLRPWGIVNMVLISSPIGPDELNKLGKRKWSCLEGGGNWIWVIGYDIKSNFLIIILTMCDGWWIVFMIP